MGALDFNLGFRIAGDCRQARRLVDASAALAGYAACDPRANVASEGYLSAFQYGDQFRDHLKTTGRTREYFGESWAQWLHFDIDRDGDLESATRDTERLCATILARYSIDADSLLVFFSGRKGFDVGVPTSLWEPKPSTEYHNWSRSFAVRTAAAAGVTIDVGVYAKVQALRAPNSRHPKTGLHKLRLRFNELLSATTAAILERAAQPEPFELPVVPPTCQTAVDDWQLAVDVARQQSEVVRQRRADASATLNRQTFDFIRHGASVGDRHRLLFSAAANLAEFGCPPALAHALLSEPGLDAGLPPGEVRRQIECGLSHSSHNSD